MGDCTTMKKQKGMIFTHDHYNYML